MESLVKKELASLIKEFEENPKKFNGTILKDLILERKNLADKEKGHAEDMKKIQLEIKETQEQFYKKIGKQQTEFMKTKGAIEYVENKIIQHSNKEIIEKR